MNIQYTLLTLVFREELAYALCTMSTNTITPRTNLNWTPKFLQRKIRERYHMEHMEYEIKVYEEAEEEVLPDTSDGKIYTSKLRFLL